MKSLQPKRGLTWPCWHPVLGLPASRTMKKDFLLFISHPIWDMLLEQPEWTETQVLQVISYKTALPL